MHPAQRRHLTTHYKKIAKMMDLEKLKPLLEKSNIFSKLMLEDIFNHENDSKRQLLLELRTRGPDAYKLFIELLSATGQTEVVKLMQIIS